MSTSPHRPRSPYVPAPSALPAIQERPVSRAKPNISPKLNTKTTFYTSEKDADTSPVSPSDHDFNPCQTNNPYSPFYDHDSPRPSGDFRKKSQVNVSTTDLERGEGLTPTATRTCPQQNSASESTEKLQTTKPTLKQKLLGARTISTDCSKRQCLSDRKQGKLRQQWNGLTRRQRLATKILIAIIVIGAMVGIGVGISMKVGGGVWQTQNQTSRIGSANSGA